MEKTRRIWLKGFSSLLRTKEVLDCGTGIELEVNEVANLVNKITGNHAGIEHLPMRKGETPNTKLAADTKTLLDLLGEFQFSELFEDNQPSQDFCSYSHIKHQNRLFGKIGLYIMKKYHSFESKT